MEDSFNQKRFQWGKTALLFGILLLLIVMLSLLLQTVWAHRLGIFSQTIPLIDLSNLPEASALTEEDYDMLFLQTGLGKSAIDRLIALGETGQKQITAYQTAFFTKPKVCCFSLLGWFTREDRIVDEAGNISAGPAPVDLQNGDIILTLSTHSLGWHHGHAGLVIDTAGSGTTLECAVLGTDSQIKDAYQWCQYSNYAILRIKDVTPEMQKAVVAYANKYLLGAPYHLTAGFFGEKAQDCEGKSFGLHCSYLVWYAWNAMGYDLDSDGGRLVSTSDILRSDLVDVVQIYGIDPQLFLK